jgi:hypothetical protein
MTSRRHNSAKKEGQITADFPHGLRLSLIIRTLMGGAISVENGPRSRANNDRKKIQSLSNRLFRTRGISQYGKMHKGHKDRRYFTEDNESNEGVFGLGFGSAFDNPSFASFASVRILLSL